MHRLEQNYIFSTSFSITLPMNINNTDNLKYTDNYSRHLIS